MKHAYLGSLAFALLTTSTLLVSAADEKSVDLKMLMLDQLKKMDISQAEPIETEHLLLYTDFDPAKAKALAASLQKQYSEASKALRYEGDEKPFANKLLVYAFSDSEQLQKFIRRVEKRLADSNDTYTAQLKSDPAYVAFTSPNRSTTLETEGMFRMSAALLAKRAGTARIPSWVTNAFNRAVAFRSKPAAYAAERARMRTLTARAMLKDACSGDDSRDAQLLATGLIEYLVYGPEGKRFAEFLSGYRVDEQNQNPDFMKALETAKFDPMKFEKAWKRWIATGR